ncbi:MAG: carboxypeptidase-like regulatory domain-containing protein, partial [Sphingobacterium sp.]
MMNNFTLHRVMVVGLLMCLQIAAFAQSGSLQGRITDKQGNAVPGATIIILGTQLSTSADGEGKYSLNNIPSKAHRVSVNMIGYITQEQSITIGEGHNTFDFILDMDASNLEEVVVIGYGTQKKGELTGSMTTVSSKD